MPRIILKIARGVNFRSVKSLRNRVCKRSGASHSILTKNYGTKQKIQGKSLKSGVFWGFPIINGKSGYSLEFEKNCQKIIFFNFPILQQSILLKLGRIFSQLPNITLSIIILIFNQSERKNGNRVKCLTFREPVK